MDIVRIAVIGIGNMGTKHALNIFSGKVDGAKLTAVCDIDKGRRDWAKANLAGIDIYDSDDMLFKNSASFDALVISVPHYDHVPIAIKAFEHGLHVMCEKPAGVCTIDVEKMNKAADKSGKVFGMMFNQRTNHLYRKMHELIHNGSIGQIKRVNWIITDWYRAQSYYDSGAWRATWAGEGGGVLLNQCPHNLDLLQWLCSMPTKVRAFCHNGKWHDIEVEDDVTAYLEFENGATGVFVTSTADAPGTNRLEVTGTKGTLICDKNKLIFKELEVDERVWTKTCEKGFEKPSVHEYEPATDGKNEQHVGVLKAFCSAILTGASLVADGREGINGLMLSNAMHLSSWLDKTVSLPIDMELFKYQLGLRAETSKYTKKTGGKVMDVDGTY